MQDAINGWVASAEAWMDSQGAEGDFSRRWILDRVMLERVEAQQPRARAALDVGCGEGRFCRLLQDRGIPATGLEPVEPLRVRAEALDPTGRYCTGQAEALPFDDGSFDLVVSYLTLIDIDGLEEALAEMVRVLRPGGQLLIANINPFCSAGGWVKDAEGRSLHFAADRYLEIRAEWQAWAGIRIVNWHRPMEAYMQPLLRAGVRLTHFSEPAPHGGPAERVEKYTRMPWFHVMEWRKD
ncbi:class I SAM-dependent methyltransferase [Ferrimonas balearica]|nr:class I SAM-dependent methyltransferase [Ferrimonas balearica]